MALMISSGYVRRLNTVKLVSERITTVSFLDALRQGGAVYVKDGTRVCVFPVGKTYAVWIMYPGGVHRGSNRLMAVYRFLVSLGFPLKSGWEVYRG